MPRALQRLNRGASSVTRLQMCHVFYDGQILCGPDMDKSHEMGLTLKQVLCGPDVTQMSNNIWHLLQIRWTCG